MKDYLVHGVQTIQRVPVRIIVVIAKGKGLRIWAVDVKHAYQEPKVEEWIIRDPQ